MSDGTEKDDLRSEMEEVATNLVADFQIAMGLGLQAALEPAISKAVAAFCYGASLQEVRDSWISERPVKLDMDRLYVLLASLATRAAVKPGIDPPT
jgi:hypothetical protein